MSLRAGFVLTTIFDPVLLEGYYTNLAHWGHLGQVKVYVIPDCKTPPEAFSRCEGLRKRGMDVVCPTIPDQEEFLSKVGFPPALIPHNSDNRRNVGYLMALAEGLDFVISIDDDNYCPEQEDFFSGHAVVCGEEEEFEWVESYSGWFNICELLELDPSLDAYPRGFPYSARHQDVAVRRYRRKATIRLNEGLWLQDPDLDGITWLVAPVQARAFKGASVVLSDRAWSPLNSQNTALHRDAITPYYYIPMGHALAGIPIDRYGDIFSGYFCQACVRHMGHGVRVGTPIVHHQRNSHNFLRDATNELACIWVLEDLLPWLKALRLEGKSYSQAYVCLSELLEQAVSKFSGFIWTDATRAYFRFIGSSMREWAKACQRLNPL